MCDATQSKEQFAGDLTQVKAKRPRKANIDGVNAIGLGSAASETKGFLGMNAECDLPANIAASKRLHREWQTIAAMVGHYCQTHHDTHDHLCPECRGFMAYATLRLARCRFGVLKPTCAKCPVHCYQRERREQAKMIMRAAGPAMLWHHPILSLRHWLDAWRQ